MRLERRTRPPSSPRSRSKRRDLRVADGTQSVSATLVSSWTAARDRLRAAGVGTPAFDARLLIEAAAGVSRMDILTDPHRALTERQIKAIEKYVVRREGREPVSQILGKKAFW